MNTNVMKAEKAIVAEKLMEIVAMGELAYLKEVPEVSDEGVSIMAEPGSGIAIIADGEFDPVDENIEHVIGKMVKSMFPEGRFTWFRYPENRGILIMIGINPMGFTKTVMRTVHVLAD